MPYKISGTTSETARVIIIKESDWSIESNTVISGSGAYEVEDLEEGKKMVFARANNGGFKGFGNVSSIFYELLGSTIWAWGLNNVGQLGLGDTSQRDEPTQIGSDTTWSQFSAGQGFTVSVKTDGTLWTCGNNTYGQLGLNDTDPRDEFAQVGSLTTWTKISGGYWHTLALQ